MRAETEQWQAVCRVEQVPRGGGTCVLVGGVQIALFHLAERQQWYAVQNRCPHWNEMVLSRALTGEQGGEPKIACPMHKKTFSLTTGRCLSGESLALHTFHVKVEAGVVYVAKPATDVVARERWSASA